MVINKKLKFGFSLFEAFVVMAIVGIFIALVSNTIAHRPKAKIAAEAHGRFECYYDNGILYQEMFTEKSSSGRVKRNTESAKDADGNYFCLFQPPSYAKYLIIDAVGGGAGGSAKGGGGEGQFLSSFYANVAREYHVYPGKGGGVGENGEKTIIKDSDGTEIANAAGGQTVVDLKNTTIKDVLACEITESASEHLSKYDCKIAPSCDITNGKIEVSFCRDSSSYVTRIIEYKKLKADGTVDTSDPRYIVNDVYTKMKGEDSSDPSDIVPDTWVYHDISEFSDYDTVAIDPTKKFNGTWKPDVTAEFMPSLYTMELIMNINIPGNGVSKSNMARFVESMQYDSDMIKDTVNVGAGGAKNQKGYAGAGLFLW